MASVEVKRECIASLENEHGVVTATILFNAVRNDPQHPLRDEYIWNGALAVEELGIIRSREIIRSVKVIVRVLNHTVVIPYYRRDPDCDAAEQGMVSFPAIASDLDKAMKILNREIESCAQAIARARVYAQVLGLEHEFERLSDMLVTTRESVDAARNGESGEEANQSI